MTLCLLRRLAVSDFIPNTARFRVVRARDTGEVQLLALRALCKFDPADELLMLCFGSLLKIVSGPTYSLAQPDQLEPALPLALSAVARVMPCQSAP
jgi:hypothetical protein